MKQEELKSVYLNTDLFILASTYEIFGMVLLEAIYFNVPILSSLNGGSSFLLDKKYIMNNFNKKEWMDKILKLDKKKIKYNKKILWKEIVDKFISNYEGVLENGKTKK
jgi:glycosyltransferase involved in cell wall biosynthesis